MESLAKMVEDLLTGLAEFIREAPSDQRMRRVEYAGAAYWVKRPERLSLRWRLQKGDPIRAFERERRGYHDMRRLGLPVADLALEGPDYLVTADFGVPLSAVMSDPAYAPAERGRALNAAAEALWRIHAAGAAHGRPNLKDILWNGEAVAFIDLERFGALRQARRAQKLDFLLFAFSCFTQAKASTTEIDAALERYRALDDQGIAEGARRWLRAIRGFALEALILERLLGARDLRALARLFAWLRRTERRDRLRAKS